MLYKMCIMVWKRLTNLGTSDLCTWHNVIYDFVADTNSKPLKTKHNLGIFKKVITEVK